MSRITYVFTVILGAVAVAFCSSVQAASPVTLHYTTELSKPAIRLSDVFAGVPEEIDRDIATSPAPGKSVTYNLRVLNGLVEQYRLDWQPSSTSDKAVLTRAATKITQEMIREAVIKKIAAQDDNMKSGGKVDVMFDNRGLEINLSSDRAPDFALNNFNYDSIGKRFRAQIAADTGAAPVIQNISGRVIIKRDVPVLSRRLSSGTTISNSDIEFKLVSGEQLTGDVITDAKQIEGMELRHDVQEGQLLHSRDVILPRYVIRGSLVTIKIKTPVLLITAQGRSLQDGGVGDIVRVTNTQSNRVIEGVVEAPGVVRIQTSQKLASAE